MDLATASKQARRMKNHFDAFSYLEGVIEAARAAEGNASSLEVSIKNMTPEVKKLMARKAGLKKDADDLQARNDALDREISSRIENAGKAVAAMMNKADDDAKARMDSLEGSYHKALVAHQKNMDDLAEAERSALEKVKKAEKSLEALKAKLT